MPFRRTTRSVTAWIAMFAILLGALAPALSHAMPQGGNGKRMVQVCTVAGVKMVAVDSQGEGKTGDADLLPAERCPFCSTAAAFPAIPSSPVLPFALNGLSEHFPSLLLDAPRTLFIWAAAQPRAPPLQHA